MRPRGARRQRLGTASRPSRQPPQELCGEDGGAQQGAGERNAVGSGIGPTRRTTLAPAHWTGALTPDDRINVWERSWRRWCFTVERDTASRVDASFPHTTLDSWCGGRGVTTRGRCGSQRFWGCPHQQRGSQGCRMRVGCWWVMVRVHSVPLSGSSTNNVARRGVVW
jgi:hypothetical protein